MEMDDRRKCILLAILSVALSIVIIGLASALAAKTGFTPLPEPEKQKVEILDDISTSTSSPPATSTSTSKPWQRLRLSREVLPFHYDIHVMPDLVAGTFRGEVDIGLRVVSPTLYVIINLVRLNVTSVKLTGKREVEAEVDLKNHFAYVENEVYVVESSNALLEGNYSLHVEFAGSLIGSLVGFYRSSYVDPAGNVTRYLAATKFEPTYARLAFPCFDEPDIKATFRIRVTHNPDMHALSNMNVENIIDSNSFPGLKETVFHNSVKMPTYLVAFIVSQFEFEEMKLKNGKPFRVYSRPDQLKSTIYGLNIGVDIQNYYEEFFDVPYPLPKQDLIGLPDFVSGAMENWGLITFRETSFFYNSIIDSSSDKRSTANTISHELTHQWFGNLVTMKWWDDLWLNEGFASYFAYEGMSQIDNDWKDWRHSAAFLLECLHVSLSLDSNVDSHPIVQFAQNPDEITALFDRISYKKGASIIRMLEAFIGHDLFKEGLRKYLRKFAYSNAETKDLWEIMTSVKPDINVSVVMNTWTNQMGYPVVFVQRLGNRFIINQTRYLVDNSVTVDVNESPFKYLWEIPLTYKLGNGEIKTHWIHHTEKEISFEDPALTVDDKFVKFNTDQTGVYRVNYPIETWEEITAEMCRDSTTSSLSVADTTHLFDDSYALFNNGMLTPAVLLKICSCLSHHPNYEMWSKAGNILSELNGMLEDSPALPLLRNLATSLIKPFYDEIGWQSQTTYREKRLQSVVLSLACFFDYTPCLTVASEKLIELLKNETSVSPDLKNVVFANGLRAAGPGAVELWEQIWSQYLIEPSANTKSNLMLSLSTTTIPWLLRRLLESVFNEEEIRAQDATNVIKRVAFNPAGTEIAWHFYRDNWNRLVQKFTLNDRSFGKLILSLTSSFASETSLSEMLTFFAKYPDTGAGERPRKQAISQVKSNIKWMETRQKDLIDELRKISSVVK